MDITLDRAVNYFNKDQWEETETYKIEFESGYQMGNFS